MADRLVASADADMLNRIIEVMHSHARMTLTLLSPSLKKKSNEALMNTAPWAQADSPSIN